MEKLWLFTDGSVHPQTGLGIGAILFVTDEELRSGENLSGRVKTIRFENTSSVKLELQTLLWALENVAIRNNELVICTDSQNISTLIERRKRLEKSNFTSKNNKRLANADLYKNFYESIDTVTCSFLKIKGHQPTRQKNKIEILFSLVDKASRKALRKETIN